jgi:hypothetical protein
MTRQNNFALCGFSVGRSFKMKDPKEAFPKELEEELEDIGGGDREEKYFMFLANGGVLLPGPAISIGLMHFFGHEVRRARSAEEKNTIVLARFLLEQYILEAIKYSQIADIDDSYMMDWLGIEPSSFYSAKKYLISSW